MEYNKKLFEALEKIYKKHGELNHELETNTSLSIEQIKNINKQLKQSNKIVEKFLEYKKMINDTVDAEVLLANEKDIEMINMAKEIITTNKDKLPNVEKQLQILLLPVDPNNDKNVIIEMRPAAGGDEASIFVANVFEMYRRYAERQN